jgi:hypothetical protein
MGFPATVSVCWRMSQVVHSHAHWIKSARPFSSGSRSSCFLYDKQAEARVSDEFHEHKEDRHVYSGPYERAVKEAGMHSCHQGDGLPEAENKAL